MVVALVEIAVAVMMVVFSAAAELMWLATAELQRIHLNVSALYSLRLEVNFLNFSNSDLVGSSAVDESSD